MKTSMANRLADLRKGMLVGIVVPALAMIIVASCAKGSNENPTDGGALGGVNPAGASGFTCSNGGQAVGGFCWFLGAAGVSCDVACGSKIYDVATENYAGSNGTSANCQAVLAALGSATTPFVVSFSSGLGCFFHIGVGASRDSASTLSGVNLANVQRACACD